MAAPEGAAAETPAASAEPAVTTLTRSPLRTIRKRDGRSVPFDAGKIRAALFGAGRASGEFGEEEARRLSLRVLNLVEALFQEEEPTVEAMQDVVEDVLLVSPYKRAAKSFILHREQHARLRALVAKTGNGLVDSYLEKLDWRVSENSNMAYSLQGLNNFLAAEISKTYWLHRIYSPDVRRAHEEGDFHIHDLNQLSVYCVGWDLRDLLATGFGGVRGKIESGPPKHFQTALLQIVNFFYTLQGEAAGAQAFSSFDTYLAPFVRADGLSYPQVRQSLQEFVFNLNVPTRVGFQTPFTNLTLDLQVPKAMRDEAVIIGGKLQDSTYGEYQKEMAWIARALFEVLAEGDAKGRVFTFPIPTVNVGADFPWEDPNLEALWRSAARYGIPYFANFVNSDMSADDARSMCCRLRLDLRKLGHRGGGLFGSHPLTGSIGVVTLNLPRLGHVAADEADFFARLDRLVDLARESLEVKRKNLESLTERGLYPYSRHYLRAIKQRSGNFWTNHFSTVGIVGANEASLNLLGKDVGTEEGKAFAVRILDHLRDRLQQIQDETGQVYNLEATPAEGAAYRMARCDAERFPGILGADGKAAEAEKAPRYTNSTQLPVDYSDDVFQVLEMQDELQRRYTGGTVLHVFTGEAQSEPESVKAFVKAVCTGYHLPYLTVTPTFSVCTTHGYQAGEVHECPQCGESCEVYSRVVGYLRPVDQWNEGKAGEFRSRASFQIGGAK